MEKFLAKTQTLNINIPQGWAAVYAPDCHVSIEREWSTLKYPYKKVVIDTFDNLEFMTNNNFEQKPVECLILIREKQ